MKETIRPSDFPALNASFVRCIAQAPPLSADAVCVECDKPAVALYADSWGVTQQMCAYDYLCATEARP